MSEDKENVECPPAKRQRTDSVNNHADTQEEGIDFSKDETGDAGRFTVGNDKYNDYVTPEELERLREFKVLDEVKSNDEDSDDEESESSDGRSEGLPEEEIEKMLDENLPEDFKGVPKPKEKPYITRQKIVLEEKGVNNFEILPRDWMMVRHYSGMPVYMHRGSRVCTLAKPYFLGKGNTRRHDIPISAIPCLAYKRALEEEVKQKEIDRRIEEQIKSGKWGNNIDKSKNNQSNKENNENSENGSIEDAAKTNDSENGKLIAQHQVAKCPFSGNDKENILQTEQSTTKCPVDHSDNPELEKTNEEGNPDNRDGKEVSEKTNDKCAEGDEGDKGDKGDKVDKSDEGAKGDEDDEEIPLSRLPVVLPGGLVMAPPRVETVGGGRGHHLSHDQLNDYCKNLFRFKTVNIMHFQRWADRRKYTKARKTLQYPTLPEGTKLITIPAQPANGQENGGKGAKRDWVMNMNGRSYLSVFHEYVRRALQKQPVYEFKQLENAATPYQATVYIGGMQYGVGLGSSKRQAKTAAARASIRVLIPEIRDELDRDEPRAAAPSASAPSASSASSALAASSAPSAPRDAEPDFSFFDYVNIEDPRVTEFCAVACEPSPHAILRTCLLRNFGVGDRHIHTEMKKLEYQKIELTMKVGKHTATVVCKNKKTAKQRASQAILQALHPQVSSWGSLLRLYGSRSVKSCKEKKLEEQQITLLQDKARRNEPNHAVLDKLRAEMRRLRARDRAVVPVGTLLVPAPALPAVSASALNHVDL